MLMPIEITNNYYIWSMYEISECGIQLQNTSCYSIKFNNTFWEYDKIYTYNISTYRFFFSNKNLHK